MHLSFPSVVMFPRMNNPAVLWKQVLPLDLVLLVSHVLECFEEKFQSEF